MGERGVAQVTAINCLQLMSLSRASMSAKNTALGGKKSQIGI